MDPAGKAHEQALRLLEFRARSRRELSLRLRQKGHPNPLIEDLLDRLTSVGLLDDRRFASERCRALALSKGWGPRKIRADLLSKGVDAGFIDEALSGVYEEQSEADLLRRVAEKKFGSSLLDGELDPKGRAKVQRFLMGRGFNAGLVRELLAGF